MKNKFLLLLILGVTFFASCSDDDDDDKGAVTYTGDNLTLSVSGVEFAGREAKLDGSTLTVKKALPGESETVFTVVREGDKITGVNKNTNREVALEGTINGDKLGLNLALKANSIMTATWKVNKLFFNSDFEGSVKVNDRDVKVSDIQTLVALLGQFLPNLVSDISFEEDGNIVAKYNPDMSKIMGEVNPEDFVTSPKGMALYNVVGDKVYIALNINSIIADVNKPKAQGRADNNSLAGLVSMVDTGIPFCLRNSEDVENGVDVYLDRETLLPVVNLLPVLVTEDVINGLLTELPPELSGYAPFVKLFIENAVYGLPQVVEKSTKVELGLQLVPPTVAE